MNVYRIPDAEFQWRWDRVQEGMRGKGLDLLLAHSNEADFANVRYLSDYWPIFESAGVLVPAEGSPALLIGPESQTFAVDRSRIMRICRLLEYRESAEPDYPDMELDSFESASRLVLPGREPLKIGLAGYQIIPLPVYNGLKKALPGAEITKSDDILSDLRMIKRPVELDMLQEAFRISEIAVAETLQQMRPEMTELQLVGIIQKELYGHGAEYEAFPPYVLSGRNTRHAIGRPRYQTLGSGELIQLGIGARVAGYSPSVGLPVCIGKMSTQMRRLVQAGLDLHLKTMEWMREGVVASTVARKFYEYADRLGVRQNILYGPCHGVGMIEVERPWIESNSDYPLQENMTFEVDTFLYNEDFGLRWENGVCVTREGVRPLSCKYQSIVEL